MKDKPKTLTPKLRFPEFEGQPWRAVNLQDVTEECATRNGDKLSSGSVMGVTKAQGIIPMEERTIGADLSRYKIVRKNWFAYNPMRLNIGSIARWSGNADVLVSPDYVVFRCLEETSTGIDPEYLDHFRRSESWEDFVTRSGIGSVRVRIYYKDIGCLRVPLPELAEQRKIAACLTSLDKWIATEGQKLEALRYFKKGLSEQLFPREDETRPRLRFPEFRDAPQWTSATLGEIADISSGTTPLRSDIGFYEGGTIPWVKTTDLNNSFITATEERITAQAKATINPVGSLLVAMYGGFKQIGRTGFLTIPAATNQALSVLQVTKADVSPLYLLIWLNAKVDDWKRIASSSRKDPNITGLDVARFKIRYPAKVEQDVIAACLSSLDALIATQSRKLDGLRAHKKGLMQQLFPAPEIAEE